MAAHITYLSETALKRKFDRKLQDRASKTFGFDADFQIESYLRHQGQTFVDRFDANSYLYITRAMDYFDLASEHGGVLANAFRGLKTRFCVFSFSSDWHYSPEENRDLVRALNAAGCETSYVNIETDKGHDAFFVEEPEFEAGLRGFIDAAANARGLEGRMK
jgi:homoserine O-acetyltransferase